jgi:hypothetical protein
LVSFPANEEAQVTALKSALPYANLPLGKREDKWDSSAATARVKDWATTDDGINWKQYQRAFFWVDSRNTEILGGYKLPYADIVDGELTAMPRGIFAATSGRGVDAADIPEVDKAKIKLVISKWYERMRREFDDDSLYPSWEKQYKSGRVLSQTNADRIRAAVLSLIGVLTDAGIDLDLLPADGEVETETEEALTVTLAAHSTVESAKTAGPQDTVPTEEQVMLAEIDFFKQLVEEQHGIPREVSRNRAAF